MAKQVYTEVHVQYSYLLERVPADRIKAWKIGIIILIVGLSNVNVIVVVEPNWAECMRNMGRALYELEKSAAQGCHMGSSQMFDIWSGDVDFQTALSRINVAYLAPCKLFSMCHYNLCLKWKIIRFEPYHKPNISAAGLPVIYCVTKSLIDITRMTNGFIKSGHRDTRIFNGLPKTLHKTPDASTAWKLNRKAMVFLDLQNWERYCVIKSLICNNSLERIHYVHLSWRTAKILW